MIRVRESIEDVPEGVLIWEEEKWKAMKSDLTPPHFAARGRCGKLIYGLTVASTGFAPSPTANK